MTTQPTVSNASIVPNPSNNGTIQLNILINPASLPMHITPDLMIVHTKEYYDLKNELQTVLGNISILNITNEKLQQCIREKEAIISSNNLTILELKQQIEIIHKMYIEEVQRNVRLDTKLLKMETNEQFNKFCVAIQDIREEYNIDDDDYEQLRIDRNSMCHYIRKKDTSDIKKAKIERFIYELNNMTSEVKDEFEYYYPGIVTKITDYLKQKNILANNVNTKIVGRYWQ